MSWEVERCCSEEERHQPEMMEGVQGRSYHRWQASVFGHLSEFLTQDKIIGGEELRSQLHGAEVPKKSDGMLLVRDSYKE